ncbi:hypothetical protein H7849_05330 [Alloacidobacterium dinghuense]|uniref:Uncharacterized protein n=1 Tax=Alloacidobacterium dinghuense TaxID=2763107 RepID=A0A7G8BLF9_9BACT|nr:hypothetical protein [Alloacidobacterium dinghuense]QNI33379.1 hypothetical protein H7849_05330 [Alloacidobacterium dinghuense]
MNAKPKLVFNGINVTVLLARVAHVTNLRKIELLEVQSVHRVSYHLQHPFLDKEYQQAMVG